MQYRAMARNELSSSVRTVAPPDPWRLPPSGQWCGMYSEDGWFKDLAKEKVASYTLNFNSDGTITGSGRDRDGTHSVEGVFNANTCAVKWRENYSGFYVEVDGKFNMGEGKATIFASFMSSLHITGSLYVQALNYQPTLRESAKADAKAQLYGECEADRTEKIRAQSALPDAEQPPDIERSPSWERRYQGNRITRVPYKAGITIARVTSGEKIGSRLNKKADKADGQLGDSKANLGASTSMYKSSAKVADANSNGGLPHPWIMLPDRTYHTGQMYYYNPETRERSWVKPGVKRPFCGECGNPKNQCRCLK